MMTTNTKSPADQARIDYDQARGAELGAQLTIDAIQGAIDAIHRYSGKQALLLGLDEAIRVARQERNRLNREASRAHMQYLAALSARY